MAKRDKLGIHAEIEKTSLLILRLGVEASLASKSRKQDTIRRLRVETEALKQLVRAEMELKIIREAAYLSIQEKLQEISKEAVGWEKYAKKNSPGGELF